MTFYERVEALSEALARYDRMPIDRERLDSLLRLARDIVEHSRELRRRRKLSVRNDVRLARSPIIGITAEPDRGTATFVPLHDPRRSIIVTVSADGGSFHVETQNEYGECRMQTYQWILWREGKKESER